MRTFNLSKISIILSLLLTSPYLSSFADTEENYENCTDCLSCGNLCKYKFSADGKNLTVYGPTQEDQTGAIPAGALTEKFSRNNNLTNVNIKGNITSIGHEVFMWDSNITSISIPETVTSIGQQAFYALRGVTGTFKIPDAVRTIGSETFYRMSGVEHLVFGNSFTSIPYYGIGETGSLKSIVLGDAMTSIDLRMVSGNVKIYCQNTAAKPQRCENLVNATVDGSFINNLVTYVKNDDGTYTSGDVNFASLEDLAKNTSCGSTDQCQKKIQEKKQEKAISLMNSGWCKTQAGCLKLMSLMDDKTNCSSVTQCTTYARNSGIAFDVYKTPDGSSYTFDAKGNLLGATKRGPFTIPEANALTKDGPVNTVTFTW